MHRLLRAQECWSSLTAWLATTACGWRTRRSAGRPTSRSCAAATAWAWRASSARCPCNRPGLGAQHKKLHAAEEAILKEAKRELNEEFAYVLSLSLEETPAFIRNLIETDEESEEAFAAHCRMLDRKHMRRAYPISPTGDYMKEKN